MENIWFFLKNSFLKAQITFINLHLDKIILVAFVITLTQLLRKLFATIIINSIEDFTRETKTDLDDELIEILKQPLSWLIFVAGLWICNFIVAGYLNPQLDETISNVLSLLGIAAIAFIIYRAAPLLGKLLGDFALKTNTELDDIIVPYLPKLFQTVAILIVVLKTGELLLGASAGALIGLLGGTGLTLCFLLKDILSDWLCTVVIYSDRLYRAGDIVAMEEIDGLAQIQEIGFRSTTLSIPSRNALKKIPNSKMITGVLENWSQNKGSENLLSINLTLQIDDISSAQTNAICEGLREIPKSIDTLSEKCSIWFSEINQNARVIEIQVLAKADSISSYSAAREQFNLAVLRLMEKEGIKLFASTPVELLPTSTPPQSDSFIHLSAQNSAEETK